MIRRLVIGAAMLLLTSVGHAAETKDQKLIRMLAHADNLTPAVSKLNEPEKKRALCLALTIFQEANGQSETAMRAVGHVVVNRTKNEDFPDTVCAVVWQVRPKRQFSWTSKSPKNLLPQDQEEWERSQRIALRVLAGGDMDPTNGATYFHSKSLKSGWAGKRKHIDRLTFIVKPKGRK